MHSPSRILFPVLILAFSPLVASSKGPIAPSLSPAESGRRYQNSPDGLRKQLLNILAAANDQNRPKLEALIKETQIPNYAAWFTTTFGQEKGESWAEPYGRDLVENQKDFERLFSQIAGNDGEIYTRKVNDNPGPPGGMEAGMIKGPQGPVDFFFASWKKRGSPKGSRGDLIGYFVFLDGKFRWDSTIYAINILSPPSPAKIATQDTPSSQTTADPSPRPGDGNSDGVFYPGVGNVTFPSCEYCPSPGYSEEARAKHVEGTVTLRIIIQPNGSATNIQIVKSLRADLDQSAVEAVSRWRFKPALGPKGNPVPVIVPVEVAFRLLH
jgi:TonB family protein